MAKQGKAWPAGYKKIQSTKVDNFMVSDKDTKEIGYIDRNELVNSIEITGELIDPIAPGTAQAPAVIPAGPAGQKRKFTPAPGFYQGFPEVTSDKRWEFYWNGTPPWQMIDLGALPDKTKIVSSTAKIDWSVSEPVVSEKGNLLVATKNTNQPPVEESMEWREVGADRSMYAKNEDDSIYTLTDNDGNILLKIDKDGIVSLMDYPDLLHYFQTLSLGVDSIDDKLGDSLTDEDYHLLLTDNNGNTLIRIDSDGNPTVGNIDLKSLKDIVNALAFKTDNAQGVEVDNPYTSGVLLSNSNSTKEARNLFYNLIAIGQSDNVIIGQQSANTLGFGRSITDPSQSDVKAIAGQMPALIGYDIGWIERQSGNVWLDGSVAKVLDAIKYNYDNGLITTISWHTRNPIDISLDQKNRDASGAIVEVGNTVARILTDPVVAKTYFSWLDMICEFFDSCVGSDEKKIPILFRPFHECTGDWFWWGVGMCSDEEYKALFRVTWEYVTKTRGVNNLIWVYNTDKVYSTAEFEARYPGNQYVDLLSFDFYDSENYTSTQLESLLTTCISAIANSADKFNKGFFLAECGLRKYTSNSYFTDKAIKFFDRRLISASFWCNTADVYYLPYVGGIGENNFGTMLAQNPNMILENSVKQLNLYN